MIQKYKKQKRIDRYPTFPHATEMRKHISKMILFKYKFKVTKEYASTRGRKSIVTPRRSSSF